ncbi:MAG TPA: MMPL family transporter [Aliidongia sp.]|nr:MMPL family transporter [Aliidongia sp.]
MNRGRAALIFWLLGLALSIGVILRTPFTTDMSAFLPRSPEPAQQILVDQLRDGVASRLILVGFEGAPTATLAAVSRSVAGALRTAPDFSLVDNGEGSIGQADQAYVWRNRYLLSDAVTPERFTPTGLHQALEQDLQLLSSGMAPLIKGSIAHDPTGETLALVRRIAGETQRQIRDGVWTAKDGTRALLLAQTRAPGFDIDAQEQALGAIRQAFAAAQRTVAGGDAVRLVATGPGVFGVKTRAQMKHDVTLYSTIATLTIVGLLLAVYRSPRMLVLTLVPVVTGALAGVAAVGAWFGFVHGITIGFGVTLIGEAVDYAIYLFAQTDPADGPEGTLRRIWPTLRLGVLVSICGFAAMLFSSFTGFVQLGVFTIVGLAVALAVTRFVLPTLVPRRFTGLREAGFAPALLRLVRRAPKLRPLLLGLALVAVGLVTFRGGTLWQDELASMSPVSPADQQVDRDLRRDVGAPDVRYMVVAEAADRESLLEACEQAGAALRPLIPAGVLSGYDSPDRYLPSDAMQARRKAALPDETTLAQNLAGALEGTPFRPDVFQPFLDDVAEARVSMPLTRAALDGTALSLKLDSLLIGRPGRWVAVMPLRDVGDVGRIGTALAGIPGAKLLDLKAESDRLLHRYRQEALLLALFGSGVIAALLLASFRAIGPAMTVLAPLALAVVVTLAILTVGGRQLSIFNLFGLLLVVAVGSNYCLFFQRGGLAGPAGERTVTSLLLANICTVVGFGALSLSRIPVLTGIGGTVAIGTALSLVAAAILTRPAAP